MIKIKQIQQFIKSKLKENADLLDKALIDNLLNYQEQKEDLRKYIFPLMEFEDKIPELIQRQQMGFNTMSKQNVWKIIRGCWN